MTKKLKAELLLVLATFVWGIGYPLTSLALNDCGPYTFLTIRSIVAALILGVLFYKKFKLINKNTLKIALIISFYMFIGIAFQVVGMVYTTPSKSAFITGLYSVFVPIILAIFYKKFPSRRTIIGVMLSVAGLSAMSIRGLNGTSGLNIGDFLTILCAVAFSMQIILVDKYANEVDATLITILELAIVGVFGLFPAISVEGFKIALNVRSIVALLCTSIFSTSLGMIIMNKMQPETDPTHASIIYLGEPVFSAIFSVFIGDVLSGRTMIGCIFILLGMVITSVKLSK